MKESKIIKTFPRFVDDTPISSPGCEYQFGIFPSGKGCFASYTKCANGVPSEVSQMIPFSQLELLLWFRCTANWGSPTTTGFTLATGLTCSWSTLVRHSSGWNCFRTRILTTLLNIIFAGCDPGAALGDFRWILFLKYSQRSIFIIQCWCKLWQHVKHCIDCMHSVFLIAAPTTTTPVQCRNENWYMSKPEALASFHWRQTLARQKQFSFWYWKGGGAEVKTPCGYDRIQRLYNNGQVSYKWRALPVGKKILPLPEVRILKSESKVLIGSDASLTFVYNRRYLKLTFPSEIYVLCNVTLKLEPKCSMDF